MSITSTSDAVVAAAQEAQAAMLYGRPQGRGHQARLSRDRLLRAQRAGARYAGKTYSLQLPLVGAFQVENALVSRRGLVIATGGEPGEGVC